MTVRFEKRLQRVVDDLTSIEIADIDAKLAELDRMQKPLIRTESIYPFVTSGGAWWIRKIRDLNIRIFFSFAKNHDIIVEWIDHRSDDTYEEVKKIWNSRPARRNS